MLTWVILNLWNTLNNIFYNYIRLVFFIIVLNSSQLYCQKKIIFEGFVVDTIKNPISFASILLKTKVDGKVTANTSTDQKGRYSFEVNYNPALSYILISQAIGYNKSSLEVVFGEQNVMKQDFILRPEEITLNEVIIRGDRLPLIQKNDTTEYDVKKYLVSRQETVENLLKKLPGIEVKDNGDITFKGKKVEKVLLDGDDLFDNKYSIATRSLKGEVLDKVQAIEHFSDNSLLKNIEVSDKIALNLQIKEDKKKLLTGSLEVASNFKSRNLLAGNGLSFLRGTKVFLTANTNNIGENPSSISNYDKSTGGANNSSYFGYENAQIIEPNILIPSTLKPQRVINSERKLAAINFSSNLTKNLKIKGFYYNQNDRSGMNQNSYEYFTLQNNSFEVGEERNSLTRKKNNELQLENFWEISKNMNFKYVFNLNKVSDQNNLSVNTSGSISMFLPETVNTFYAFLGHFVDFTGRLNARSAFKVEAKHHSLNMPQDYALPYNLSFQNYVGVTPSFLNIEQKINPKNQQNSVLVKFLGKGNTKTNYSGTIGYQEQRQFIGSSIHLSKADTSVILSKKYYNFQTSGIENYYLDVNYRRTHKKFNYLVGVNWSFIKMKMTSNENKESRLNRFIITPHIMINQKIGNSAAVLLDYSYNLTNPNLMTYYPNLILTDYRTFTAGLPTLANWRNHLGIFNFSENNLYSNIRYGISAILSIQENTTETIRTITPYMSVASYVLAQKPTTFLSLNSNFEKYFPAIFLNIKTKIGYNSSKLFSNLNGNERIMWPKNTDYQVEFSSAFDGVLNTDLKIKYTQNKLKIRNLKSDISMPSSIWSFYERLNFKPSKTIRGSIYAEQFLVNTNLERNINYILDFQCSYLPTKSKFSFALDIKNIFDAPVYQLQSLTDYSINRTQYPLIGRWVMINIGYQF
jgi:hypothetical protein